MSSFRTVRDNLDSEDVDVHFHSSLGEGNFREVVDGTYIGGNRNQQRAACKAFKPEYSYFEDEYYEHDSNIADKAIEFAEEWNGFCQVGYEIMITKGEVQYHMGKKWLIEPFINYYTKFTSNGGWISGNPNAEAMEAFSHFTYKRSGGQLIVTDLQGRFRTDHPRNRGKSKQRYELTDLAICSRRRLYGPTDLGEKGILSFFSNHECNGFCHMDEHWPKPKREQTRQYFPMTEGTSILASHEASKLQASTPYVFTGNGVLESVLEEDEDYDSDFM